MGHPATSMTLRIDPGLGPSPSFAAPAVLGRAESPVARAGVAGPSSFLLEGERMAVAGREGAGRQSFWLGGVAVVRDLDTDAGPAANAVAAPQTLRRELLGREGSVLETTMVTPSLPLAVVQWTLPTGGRGPASLGISLTVLPGHRKLRYNVLADGVRTASDDGETLAVELRVHPPPLEWSVAEGADGGMEVRARVPFPGPVTLLVAAGPPAAALRAVAAGAHLQAHETRCAADWDPSTMETLVTATGVSEVDHAVVWATARVRGSLVRGASSPADGVFWTGVGALAVGDDESAIHALGALRRSGLHPVPWLTGGSTSPHALATLLAARMTLLSGDPGPAQEALQLLPGGEGGTGSDSGHGDGDPAVWALALTTLADALRDAAPPDQLAELRRKGTLASPVASALPPGGVRTVRLPMAGGGPPTPLPWTPWAEQDPDAAWAAWRSSLAGSVAAGPTPGPAPAAGILLCALAHGLLGLAPDAPSGRLRLAPALPAHVSAFTARGIRVGDVRLTFRYQKEHGVHTFLLEPTAGRVPAMVILEPALPLGQVGAMRVDGVPAGLDAHHRGSRTLVRVQIPLDGPRSLEVEEPA